VEANNPEAAVIGTLNNHIYSGKLLFDTGATTSSIPKSFANNLEIRWETIDPLMSVVTAEGKF
jgi:predicted aspartyl protease